MKFETKYRLILQKYYFDKGYNVSKYLLYMIGLFGLASNDVRTTMWIAIFYTIGCYILGRHWVRYKWAAAAHEVDNRINPFVKEMRRSIKRKV